LPPTCTEVRVLATCRKTSGTSQEPAHNCERIAGGTDSWGKQ
jgi:hypothetical protein